MRAAHSHLPWTPRDLNRAVEASIYGSKKKIGIDGIETQAICLSHLHKNIEYHDADSSTLIFCSLEGIRVQ